MRLIDADELLEHVWRDKLDSREAIAKMVKSAPTIKVESASAALEKRITKIENDMALMKADIFFCKDSYYRKMS
jgi:uncharacterized protein YfcZ (UPF0381/DUF406 family)